MRVHARGTSESISPRDIYCFHPFRLLCSHFLNPIRYRKIECFFSKIKRSLGFQNKVLLQEQSFVRNSVTTLLAKIQPFSSIGSAWPACFHLCSGYTQQMWAGIYFLTVGRLQGFNTWLELRQKLTWLMPRTCRRSWGFILLGSGKGT